MDRTFKAVREFISQESSFFETLMTDTGTPADQTRRDGLITKGLEFKDGSCFHVIIHTTIPDCDMRNPTKMADGLQAKMSQGHSGHMEKEMVRPGWQSLRITYDIRDLEEYDTTVEKIYLALWGHFKRTVISMVRDEDTEWEESLTISKRLGIQRRVIVKVELWPKDQGDVAHTWAKEICLKS